MSTSKLRILLFIGALMGPLVACSDTDDGGSTSSADGGDRNGRDLGTIADTGGSSDQGGSTDTGSAADTSVGTDTGSGAFSCDDIPVNGEAGSVCTGAAGECADGACITTEEGADPICRQICVPGQCESFCSGDERCLTLIDSETGQPQMIPDTDFNLGVCGVPPTGDAGAFAECGGTEACQTGFDCLILEEGATSGQCFPQCGADGTCDQGECVIAAGTAQYCALTCTTPGSADECPDGMSCVSAGTGSICHYE